MELRDAIDLIGYPLTALGAWLFGRRKNAAQTVAIEVESLRLALKSLQETVQYQSERIRELEAEVQDLRGGKA